MTPGNNEVTAHPQAAPSLAGPTHTSEPIPGATPGSGPVHGQDADVNPPPLPTQVRDHDRYHFLGEHGRGGLGRVSRAHDRELGRDVAIKELLSRTNANEVRFLREVLITARLEHPGIVPVHEAGRWADGTPFYAMKLVAGRPLRDLIAERTTVEQRLGLLQHVIAVADAIAYAHGRNIIHRDLKPANVIVGDFGETVVIDWGLAKDLTSAETSSVGSGPFRTNPSSEDLTSTGSVLGTPAYMPPEQKRGEPVDQRADVFAIGTMLWEICAPQKVPPAGAQHRRRMLRRAGIDADLVAIIEKALAPDPERRYPHAGALAADLRAFTAGARIAARSYSLPAMLAHWTRRHRALALSAAAVIAILAIGGLIYVRNIAAERDRADSSEHVAVRARASAETSLDELTLKHAELLLVTDPSAALDEVARYHGADTVRAARVRAEAVGRGVAVLRAQPHTDWVRWTQRIADGAIISLGLDGTIMRTARDGTSVVLARDVARSSIYEYSAPRHLLVYTCNPSDLCMFDVERGARIPTAPLLRDPNVKAFAFSPGGTLLATMSKDAVLRVLDITNPAQPVLRLTRPIVGGSEVEFAGDDVAVAGTSTSTNTGTETGIEFVRIAGGPGRSEHYALPGLSRWAPGTGGRELALATAAGDALVIESFPRRVVARATLCHGPTVGLRFVAGRRIAYACKDGAVGLWDLQQGTARTRAQIDGHIDLIAASASGDYLVAAGGNGIVTVLDLTTDLVTSYKGHGFRLTSLSAPTPEHPFVISGDARGGIRAWPLPARLAHVAATSSQPFHAALFDEQSTTLVATTWEPALTTLSPSSGPRTTEPHLASNVYLERAGTGRVFATYGLEDTVELWSAATMTRTRVIRTGHGSISQLRFAAGTTDVVTSGNDGRLVRWPPGGEPILLAQARQPIDGFAMTR
ncbi:MAG TPA: WD40 repeat domain-containing serine/threonine-protein kinase, partial [Kofleriaceae bacterium]